MRTGTADEWKVLTYYVFFGLIWFWLVANAPLLRMIISEQSALTRSVSGEGLGIDLLRGVAVIFFPPGMATMIMMRLGF